MLFCLLHPLSGRLHQIADGRETPFVLLRLRIFLQQPAKLLFFRLQLFQLPLVALSVVLGIQIGIQHLFVLLERLIKALIVRQAGIVEMPAVPGHVHHAIQDVQFLIAQFTQLDPVADGVIDVLTGPAVHLLQHFVLALSLQKEHDIHRGS